LDVRAGVLHRCDQRDLHEGHGSGRFPPPDVSAGLGGCPISSSRCPLQSIALGRPVPPAPEGGSQWTTPPILGHPCPTRPPPLATGRRPPPLPPECSTPP